MKKLFTLLVALTGVFITASAQQAEAVFKVLAAQGDVVSTRQNEQQRLSAGKQLLRDQVVQVTGKAYVGLVHKSGKSLELKEPGTYNVWELDAVISKNANVSLTKKYAKYVFNELKKDDEGGMRRNHQQYMAVTGAVTRGANAQNVVHAYVPAATVIAEGLPPTLCWSSMPNTKGYTIMIQDLFDTVIWKQDTRDTAVKLDFAKLQALNQTRTGIIKVGTTEKGFKNAVGHPIKLATPSEVARIKAELAELQGGEESNPSALSHMMLGYYFEQQNLHLNALDHFRQAAIISPEVEDFRLEYQEYMFRTGILLGQ